MQDCKKKLYIVRHGQSMYNAQMRDELDDNSSVSYADSVAIHNPLHDCSLTEKGIAQAKVPGLPPFLSCYDPSP